MATRRIIPVRSSVATLQPKATLTYSYLPTRPNLTIDSTVPKSIGRCRSETRHTITCNRKLTSEQLYSLFTSRIISEVDQEFSVKSKCDGSEEPSRYEYYDCAALNESGDVVEKPAINPYSGKIYEPRKVAYYSYTVVTTCDSSD